MLSECIECNHKVSSEARRCPGCGTDAPDGIRCLFNGHRAKKSTAYFRHRERRSSFFICSSCKDWLIGPRTGIKCHECGQAVTEQNTLLGCPECGARVICPNCSYCYLPLPIGNDTSGGVHQACAPFNDAENAASPPGCDSE